MTLKLLALCILCLTAYAHASTLRESIVAGDYSDFIVYSQSGDSDGSFHLLRSFAWQQDAGLSNQDYIVLKVNEIFDGHDYEIDLNGIEDWGGLLNVFETIETFNTFEHRYYLVLPVLIYNCLDTYGFNKS